MNRNETTVADSRVHLHLQAWRPSLYETHMTLRNILKVVSFIYQEKNGIRVLDAKCLRASAASEYDGKRRQKDALCYSVTVFRSRPYLYVFVPANEAWRYLPTSKPPTSKFSYTAYCPQTAVIDFLRFSKQTANISLNSTDQLVFIMGTHCSLRQETAFFISATHTSGTKGLQVQFSLFTAHS